MDRKDNPYGKNLDELDLAEFALLCASVAHNFSATRVQNDTAHALRMEWVRLNLDHSLGDGKKEIEASLKKRMLEFLSGVPGWMMSGV